MYALDEVRMTDPEIAQAIEAEQQRQNSHIELIASEKLGEQGSHVGYWEARLRTSMRKGIRGKDIMAAVNVWM